MNIRKQIGYLVLASGLAEGQVYNSTTPFDVNPPLSATQAPGLWYPDRYEPTDFNSFVLSTENVLRIGIDGTADAAASRPVGFTGQEFNIQGRKLDLPAGSYALKGSLFVPSAWLTDIRRSDLSGSLVNGVGTTTGSPVIGMANLDGSTPVIRYWDGSAWVDTSISVAADTWYDLEMVLVGENLVYRVDSVDVGSIPFAGSVRFGDVSLQAYNFNDLSLPVAQQSSDSYEAYWDNFEIASSLVLNVTQSTPHATIQAAIDAASNLDTIRVFEGSFPGNLTVNKDLTLEGPNAGVNGVNGSRATEAIVDGQVTVSSAGVTLDGFTFSNLIGNIAIFSDNVGDLEIINNKISGVNTSAASFAVGIYVKAPTNAVSNFTITANRIDAIGGPSTDQAVKAIYFGEPTGQQVISNIVISGNRIDNVESGTDGAYGVHFDHGVDPAATGTVSGIQVTSNTFSAIEGDFVHAVGLETETGAATVTGNELFNLTANGGANEAVGVFFEENPIGGPASDVSQNLFRNSMSAGVQVHTDDTYTVDASANFWDASDGPLGINGSTAVGSGTPVSDNVIYSPWYAEAGRVNLVTLANFTNFTVATGATRVEVGDLYIGAGATATVRGSLVVPGKMILEDGGSLVVIDGNFEMGNASVISGTFTVFNSFGSWDINGNTIFNVSQSLALVTDIHVAAGVAVTVNGGGELILDGCVLDSQTPGSSYNLNAATDGLLTIARCNVTDAVIDIDSTSAGSRVYDSYFTDSSIEASSDAAVYHNLLLSGTTVNANLTTAFDPVDGWGNVMDIVDLQNLFTLDLDIGALPNRTLDSDETVYVQPTDVLIGAINVRDLSTKINSVEVMLGYSTDFFDASSIALDTDWNVDLNSLDDDSGSVGKLDSAIGLRFDFPDPVGTDADGTIGTVTLTGQGVEGQSQFFHRVKVDSDAFGGETRFTTGGSSPSYLSPFTVNSGLIVIDGTAPVISVASANATQVQDFTGTPVDVLDPDPAAAPAFTFRNGNTMTVTFTASDIDGSGLDTTDLVNDFTFSATNGTTTLNTFATSTSEAAGVVTYTVVLDIPTTATNGTYDVTATVTDRSGNVSALTDLGEFVLANELHTNIQLEGFTGGLRDVTFVATDSVGAVLTSWIKTVSFTGDLGSVSLEGVPNGTTNLSAKTDWNLRSNIAVSFSGTGVGSANFTGADQLPGGDINGDNAVNTLDYSILRFNWLDTDPTADINGTGVVDLIDYNLLRLNFYTSGDAE